MSSLGTRARRRPGDLKAFSLSAFRAEEKESKDNPNQSLPPGWEDANLSKTSEFTELPHRHFGFNQHMLVNAEFKEALRGVLWQFRAPIRYAFAYGSGVFPQTRPGAPPGTEKIHPNPPDAVTKWQKGGQKNIDFIFGVSYTQHWHSLNLQQHKDHYSMLGSMGSAVVSRIQDNFGAGAYFHPYIIINGLMVKYGVVNLDTLYQDLTDWNTMYLAGRLHKPVKILRDDARIRLANQVNLISALRTALLCLPENFTEKELYSTIAAISYWGDPRIALRAESPRKVENIVDNQMANFRQLYLPLLDDLPNVSFNDPAVSRKGWSEDGSLSLNLAQDIDPIRRGNMVRRLPKEPRARLYDAYRTRFRMDAGEFRRHLESSSPAGGELDRRIAGDAELPAQIRDVVKSIINRPSMKEAFKGVLSAGVRKSLRYFGEKRAKGAERRQEAAAVEAKEKSEDSSSSSNEAKK